MCLKISAAARVVHALPADACLVGNFCQRKIIQHIILKNFLFIKMALLEADVNFKVVKNFVSSVQERAVGEEVLSSLTPGQMVIKIAPRVPQAPPRR